VNAAKCLEKAAPWATVPLILYSACTGSYV
jgi:hypothetical protein